MGNIVKLVFNAVATGSGFSKLFEEVKGLSKAMPGLTNATMILGQTFGSVGASVGKMATMLLQGSIWGVAAEGAKLLIDKLGLFKDKTEETKEKLDKLEESTRKFYETINASSQKSIEKIDSETKRRNEQLDITNRMIKAELQLQRARAISSGDAKGVERIDRQIAEQDQKTALQKAGYAVESSAKRREWINNMRFAEGAADLIGRGKIRRGPNGEWVANGRLSNMNQAILDRLNADENKRKLEKENDKVVRKLDELKKAIEQMSTL